MSGTEAFEDDLATLLPRTHAGVHPQRLVVTLLGDYWSHTSEHIPSTALVRLLDEFAVTAISARAAIRRLVERGALEASPGKGRRGYRIPAEHIQIMTREWGRLQRHGISTKPWDDRWTIAAFSMPEEARDVRRMLRARLRWLGFAPLYDGFWISPLDRVAAADDAFAALGVPEHTVLRCSIPPGLRDQRDPIAAWDLTTLKESYQAFISAFQPLHGRLHGGEVGASEALLERTRLMDRWRELRRLDPGLPQELLPPEWPRAAARALFGEIYNQLGPLAEIRFQHIVSQVAPRLARVAKHHTMLELHGNGTAKPHVVGLD